MASWPYGRRSRSTPLSHLANCGSNLTVASAIRGRQKRGSRWLPEFGRQRPSSRPGTPERRHAMRQTPGAVGAAARIFIAGPRAASQCIRVTANTTMIAALSEPMTARGTVHSGVSLLPPSSGVRQEDVRGRLVSTVRKKLCVVGRNGTPVPIRRGRGPRGPGGSGGRRQLGPHYSDLICQHLRRPVVSEKAAVKTAGPAVSGNRPDHVRSRPRDRSRAPDGVWGSVGTVGATWAVPSRSGRAAPRKTHRRVPQRDGGAKKGSRLAPSCAQPSSRPGMPTFDRHAIISTRAPSPGLHNFRKMSLGTFCADQLFWHPVFSS